MVKETDQRFKKSQAAIDRVVGKFIRKRHIAGIKVAEVSKEADIYCSTFYNHHSNIDDAVAHFDNRMQEDLQKIIDESIKANYSLKIVYSKLLYFILKHKNYYSAVIKGADVQALAPITEAVKPIIMKLWYGKEHNRERRFARLAWRIYGEIWWWGEQEKFTEEKLAPLAKYFVDCTMYKN